MISLRDNGGNHFSISIEELVSSIKTEHRSNGLWATIKRVFSAACSWVCDLIVAVFAQFAASRFIGAGVAAA